MLDRSGLLRILPYILLVILVTLIISATYIYLLNFHGILLDYDDAIYAYGIENVSSLATSNFGSFIGSLGFVVYGRPFLLVFGNTLFMPTAVGLSSIILTIIVIFFIGKTMGDMRIGLLAAAFYALNPLTFTYAQRLIPDTFTTLLLALGILIAISGSHNRRRRKIRLFAGAFVVGLGLFFGPQTLFSLLAFVFIVLILEPKKQGKKQNKHCIHSLLLRLGLIFTGAAAALMVYLAFNGLKTLKYMSNEYLNRRYPHSITFFMHVLLPLGQIGGSAFYEPYTNMGILFILLAIVTIIGAIKKDRRILAYSAASFAITLYLFFGSDRLSTYIPILNVNRLTFPILLTASMAVASWLASIKMRRTFFAVTFILLLMYIATFFRIATPQAQINYMGGGGLQSVFEYKAVESIATHLKSVSTSGFSVYENITSTPESVCYILNTPGDRCFFLSNSRFDPCNRTTTIIISMSDSCKMPYYYNSTFGYYIYT
jgi:4-amino-4-deoxy-L-arabinose transferase-like glycosyltransferase